MMDFLWIVGITLTILGVTMVVIGLLVRHVIAPWNNRNPPTGF